MTLLGDAAHPAPPGGLGANLALADVDLLCRTLLDVRAGRIGLIPALAAYDERIRADGGAAIEQANQRLDSFDRLRSETPA